MENDFEIELCSDLDYEEMVVDISWDNEAVAMVTQEKGIDNMEIEIFARDKLGTSWSFPVDKFIQAVQQAKNFLIKMQKIDDSDSV
ncbi:MAG: hypothetical protein JWO53_490 [Chlamydiia bacterium]|nr:hypothetical protein [Chlamydiia bacterium]